MNPTEHCPPPHQPFLEHNRILADQPLQQLIDQIHSSRYPPLIWLVLEQMKDSLLC